MPLKGIKVLELAGLAPAPFCGMILSDFGANVIRIDKVSDELDIDRLARGKRSLSLDLKNPNGIETFRRLSSQSDVVLEPFRKGIMEKLGLGPTILMKDNPKLIYARLTGFGQSGCYAEKAGHDINYLAISGVLSMLGRKHENPLPPINLLGDFAGGGLVCALGIVLALLERQKSGKGQIIDANIVEGTAYISTWLWTSKDLMVWGRPRGENMLDGGSHFYDTYQTKDGKYMAVGSLEPKFFNNFIKGLNAPFEIDQLDDPAKNHQKIKKLFAEKTQEEWIKIFDQLDACVFPVLSQEEASEHLHSQERKSFIKDVNGMPVPRPAPVLERTPGVPRMKSPNVGEHTVEVLLENGFKKTEIDSLLNKKIVYQKSASAKL